MVLVVRKTNKVEKQTKGPVSSQLKCVKCVAVPKIAIFECVHPDFRGVKHMIVNITQFIACSTIHSIRPRKKEKNKDFIFSLSLVGIRKHRGCT